jgi:hypothetical protein
LLTVCGARRESINTDCRIFLLRFCLNFCQIFYALICDKIITVGVIQSHACEVANMLKNEFLIRTNLIIQHRYHSASLIMLM